MNTDELTLTQEAVAEMIGVPKSRVVAALGTLRVAGLLRYGDGQISVVDRAGLEVRACECYSVVKQESDRLFHRAAGAAKAVPPETGPTA